MMIINKYHHALMYVAIATFLFFYLWALLLARLDQLATGIGKSPNKLVYATLLIPILGTFASYYYIQHLANQVSPNSH